MYMKFGSLESSKNAGDHAVATTQVSEVAKEGVFWEYSKQYIQKFFESVGRSEVLTDISRTRSFDLRSLRSNGPVTIRCFYSVKDRYLFFELLEDVTGIMTGLDATIYSCWYAASKAEPGNSEPFESPRYLTIQNVRDPYSFQAIQRLVKLWLKNGMDVMPNGAGFSILRADVSPNIVEKDFVSGDQYISIHDAAWVILHQPWQIYGIIQLLGDYQYGLSRLQISNIRFSLYRPGGKLVSKSDVGAIGEPNAIEYADIFLELEKRPAAHSSGDREDENMESPPREEGSPDEIVGGVDSEDVELPIDEDIIMNETPSRGRSLTPALQLQNWESSPFSQPSIHPLGLPWILGFTVKPSSPSNVEKRSYMPLNMRYTADVSFQAYASVSDGHLFISPQISSAEPPEKAIPPHVFASVIRSAWLHSGGGSKFVGLTIGRVQPKTEDALGGTRRRRGAGSSGAPSGTTKDSFAAHFDDGTKLDMPGIGIRKRFDVIFSEIATTWEGQSILHLIAADDGVLGVNDIFSIKYGLPLKLRPAIDGRYLTFRLSKELPLDSTAAISSVDNSATKAGQVSLAVAKLLAVSFETGTRFRVEDQRPIDYSGPELEAPRQIKERVGGLKLRYIRKHLRDIEADTSNDVPGFREAIETFKLIQDPKYPGPNLLADRSISPEKLAVLRDPSKLGKSTHRLTIFGSTEEEIETNDKKLPRLAWSEELNHLAILQQPSFDSSDDQSSSLADIFVLETLATKESSQLSKSVDSIAMGEDPGRGDLIRFFTFLDVQPASRAILSYIVKMSVEYSESRPVVLTNPFYEVTESDQGTKSGEGTRKITFKNGVETRLLWLIILGLPEVRAVSQYAKDTCYFTEPGLGLKRPDLINAIVIRWISDDTKPGTLDLKPIFHIQLSSPTDENSPVRGEVAEAFFHGSLAVQQHLRLGERLELQEIYRPFLPGAIKRGGLSEEGWIGRVEDNMGSEASFRSHPVLERLIPLAFNGLDGLHEFDSEDHIRSSAGNRPLTVQVTNTREALSLQLLVDRRGGIIAIMDEIPTLGEPEEATKKFSSAIYTAWLEAVRYNSAPEHEADTATPLGRKIKGTRPPGLVLITKLSMETRDLLWSTRDIDNPHKEVSTNHFMNMYGNQKPVGEPYLSRTTQVKQKDIVYTVVAFEPEPGIGGVFFRLLLGTPEVASVLQAFQNYQSESEMRTWQSYLSSIYVRWTPFAIVLLFKSRDLDWTYDIV
ncbi:hypothetical protein AOL_s00004g102 [Orbilia oligospora ATCC 24927]|uniref:Uncharacterized protein n=1 Tax=Arthrobotrys oligospora (strain ATCC 24927 / CBS 115.81 / DSM 1491) TaxID=756982 RepID=G1WXU2_ARTOA|nr:hypothetical protein AOL_s00004g102 [Orbilia oligospora ATCC 24927]EGX54069.1 hypothetical protein AOL_s00004g102 [Orbilia oligospora ATCC 24927]